MTAAFLVVGAYLPGAVPFGLLIGLARGVDIRKAGSGNIGATNAGRVLGRKWGFLCLALDILKGLIPTLIARGALLHPPLTSEIMLQWVLVGAATVIGHTFPVYLGFRGGKGVATTIGAGLGFWPALSIPMIVALLVYGAVRYTSGVVSAGSIALAVALPIAFFAYCAIVPDAPLGVYWPLGAIAVALGLLIIIRHRSNIARLIRGEELAVKASEDE
ncbi:MAG: glycerol-3-phosphate acyltransferase [Planctomycetes bacterium]|nr:glycerol-3-phosphate acyltransferase [Planctomycetota bacterium]